MNWLLTILIALLMAVAGFFAGAGVGTVWVKWFRISSFEGGSGFFTIGIALVGGVIGVVVTLIAAGVIGSPGQPLKLLGVSAATVCGIAAMLLLITRLFAHIPPRLDGQGLRLEVELRLPPGAEKPDLTNEGGSWLHLHAFSMGNVVRSDSGLLQLDKVREESGRWIIPGETGSLVSKRGNQRVINFQLGGKGLPESFELPLPSSPRHEHLQWSDWIPPAGSVGKAGTDDRPAIHFRVQKIIPPPPPPTEEERNAAEAQEQEREFAAAEASGDLQALMAFTSYPYSDDIQARACKRIAALPDLPGAFLSLFLSGDAELAGTAMRLVPRLPVDISIFKEALETTGDDIARSIQTFNTTSVADDPNYYGAAKISHRFNGWMNAVRESRQRAGGDFIPQLRAILEVSRVRVDSHAMQTDVRRVASYYLHTWAGIPPQPGDPPPR